MVKVPSIHVAVTFLFAKFLATPQNNQILKRDHLDHLVFLSCSIWQYLTSYCPILYAFFSTTFLRLINLSWEEMMLLDDKGSTDFLTINYQEQKCSRQIACQTLTECSENSNKRANGYYVHNLFNSYSSTPTNQSFPLLLRRTRWVTHFCSYVLHYCTFPGVVLQWGR